MKGSKIIKDVTMLMGREIKTVIMKDLIENENDQGQSVFRKDEIRLQDSKTVKRKLCDMEITYLHELLHWIFYLLEEKELCDNEKLISIMSELLYQALK